MEISLRAVVAKDFPLLYALDQACFAPGISWSKAELQYFLKYPGNIGLVAEDGQGRIAGFAIAGKQLRKGAVLGRLITIDVDPGSRRAGIGHRLLTELEGRLRAMGASAMLLEVAVDNTAAQEFYARHGFEATGRIRGYYLGRIDALVMEKTLPSAESGKSS
ncbi:MAG TPA: N-acetyltransferase [Acidobacteriaceae bacterium]|nr:N-acetyltransferase [Acidobacteriaceae bacterium]